MQRISSEMLFEKLLRESFSLKFASFGLIMANMTEEKSPFLEIGNRLVKLRKLKGYNQQEAADILKIKQRTYQNYEYGERQPNTGNLKKIIDYYGCDYSWLLTGEGVPYPDKPQENPTEPTVEPQKDLPIGSFDKFLYEIKRSREIDHIISDLITSKRQGGFDSVLFKAIYDVMREFLNKNGREDLDSVDFGIAAIIQTIYRELKRTPTKEELMTLISTLHALGQIFPHGVPLTPHEQLELFSWGRKDD